MADRTCNAHAGTRRLSLKEAARAWVLDQLPRLEHMLTLTLKQHLRVSGTARRFNQHGYKSYQKLDRFIAEKVAAQFIERLNSEVFHTAARRYGKSLFYLPVLERGEVSERLHLHIGIGAIPTWARGAELYKAVGRAAKHTDWIDEQLNIVEADAYALAYITKQVERHNTDAILWQCVPEASTLHAF